MKVKSHTLIVFIGFLLAACGSGDGGDGSSEETTTTVIGLTTTTESTTETTTPGLPNSPDRVTTTTIPAVTGEVPREILQRVIEDAAESAGVEPDAIDVVRAQEIEWPDGALGCPEPGQVYTQAIVPGYWVEIEAPDDTYDYRLDRQGNFKLCESEVAPPSQGGFVTPTTTGSDS